MMKPNRKHTQFVKFLCDLAPPDRPDAWNRAALAGLRRGLGKPAGVAVEAAFWVDRYLKTLDVPEREEEPYFLIASLFASHPQNDASLRSLGATFAAIWQVSKPDEKPEFDRRFIALLDSHVDDLPKRLRHAVSLAKSKEQKINWAQLLSDVSCWGHWPEAVRRQWSRDYWGAMREQRQDQDNDQRRV